MFKTPNIPEWIMEISHPAYRNIFDYNLGNQNLWGTETLLGDWDGKYLLIAKDFYPTSKIEDALRLGDANPYHYRDIRTNRNLLETLKKFEPFSYSATNTNCDFLYVSACFLLRDDGQVSGPLPDRGAALELSAPVLAFTMDHMPRLETVILMGEEAADVACIECVDNTIRERGLRCFQVSHPAARISDADRFAEWEPIFAGTDALE